MPQIDLRMNGQVNCPHFWRLAETVQSITTPAKIVAINAFEGPFAFGISLEQKPAIIITPCLLTADLAVLVS